MSSLKENVAYNKQVSSLPSPQPLSFHMHQVPQSSDKTKSSRVTSPLTLPDWLLLHNGNVHQYQLPAAVHVTPGAISTPLWPLHHSRHTPPTPSHHFLFIYSSYSQPPPHLLPLQKKWRYRFVMSLEGLRVILALSRGLGQQTLRRLARGGASVSSLPAARAPRLP